MIQSNVICDIKIHVFVMDGGTSAHLAELLEGIAEFFRDPNITAVDLVVSPASGAWAATLYYFTKNGQ